MNRVVYTWAALLATVAASSQLAAQDYFFTSHDSALALAAVSDSSAMDWMTGGMDYDSDADQFSGITAAAVAVGTNASVPPGTSAANSATVNAAVSGNGSDDISVDFQISESSSTSAGMMGMASTSDATNSDAYLIANLDSILFPGGSTTVGARYSLSWAHSIVGNSYVDRAISAQIGLGSTASLSISGSTSSPVTAMGMDSMGGFFSKMSSTPLGSAVGSFDIGAGEFTTTMQVGEAVFVYESISDSDIHIRLWRQLYYWLHLFREAAEPRSNKGDSG